MPRRSIIAAAVAIVFVLAAGTLPAQDWEGVAAASDRSMDSFIVQIIAEGDLETGIALCKGVGRRKDLDVQAVIDSLVARRTPGSEVKSEVMLRWLVVSAMEAHPETGSLLAWSAANSRSVDMLLERISLWKSAQLKGALLAFAVIAPADRGARAIMDVGQDVVRELEDAPDGLIPSQDTALALDFLEAARQSGSAGFFPVCADIARLSREKLLVDAARSAALDLSAR
jgi:hypothetical protein